MIKKLYSFLKSLDKRLKFVLVGILNTVIGYGINFGILLFVFGIPFDAVSKATYIQALTAAASGHLIGMVNSFFWNKYFTFNYKDNSFSQVYRFFAVSLLQLALSYGLLMFIQNVLGAGIYISQAITLVITTVLSYLGHNYFSFKTKE